MTTTLGLLFSWLHILHSVAVLGGGLRGLEHPPRSKFRFQRELTGVLNSFSSAKTHCREPTARAPITRARSITTTPTMSMSMRIAKARGVLTAVMKSKPSAQFDYALGEQTG